MTGNWTAVDGDQFIQGEVQGQGRQDINLQQGLTAGEIRP